MARTLPFQGREAGSEPVRATILNIYAPVAQLVEHLIEDQGVGGSNPSGSTIIFSAGISRVNTITTCGCGGIGRRPSFRYWYRNGVGVRVPSSAPIFRNRKRSSV